MATTWNNEIEEFAVSIALEHIFFAPVGTAYDRSRIDPSSPPAGFVHLGAVVDDQPQLTINKQKYQLFTGIPRVLVYEAMFALGGELATVFHSNQTLHAYMGLGGPRPRNIPVTAHTTTPPKVDAATLSRTVVAVDSPTTFSLGQLVVTDGSTLTITSYNVAFVASIGANSYGPLYLSGEGFAFDPVAGEDIYAVVRNELALGTKVIPYFRVLGVADFLNGAQVVHDFQKATPRGQWVEQLRTTQDARMPAVFDLFGYTTTNYGGSELIVGERYQFAPNTIA